MNINQLLAQAITKLQTISDTPKLDAELLLAHSINQSRTFLYAWPEKNISPAEAEIFSTFMARRLNKEPVAYIIGRKEFWSLDLQVTTDTLIPRPETELLVSTILDLFPHKHTKLKIADLGTGSGAIALALAKEHPEWEIYATDISQKALHIASKNAQRFKFNNISFYQGNWCTALPCSGFDVIVSNPPYIAESEWQMYSSDLVYEPRNALVAEDDGLSQIRLIAHAAKQHLSFEGYVLVEHGFLQASSVCDIFAEAGYQSVRSIADLAGNQRVTIGYWQAI